MIQASGITLRFGKRVLFEDVNIKFTQGNCYGLIGANGSGKSTFLKILSGEIESSTGEIITGSNERLAVLKQDHYEYDKHTVIETVIMGHKKLYEIMKQKDELYAKPDFSEADGLKAAELEHDFAEMDGWNAETDAATLLSGLGLEESLHYSLMKDLSGGDKVRVLLAQALFGNPDILLLDEPTNHLDIDSISWLEEFLINFDNTVIVVSHDRHFLNKVCTHIADIDFSKITMYVGNYDFWYESSRLAQQQMKDENKKKEQKMKELQDFIRRFSSNASKARQATSRKKVLEKIQLDDIRPSSRKYPYIAFTQEREAGKEILTIENLSKTVEGVKVLNKFSLTVNKGEKIALVGSDALPKTTLFKILFDELKPDDGEYKWGITTSRSYFPKDNSKYFNVDYNLIDWLRQYAKNQEETYIRGFLGRMLFSGEESLKSAKVLSGGEKVRCMLSRMMLSESNILVLDEPTNHLDLETITSLNDALISFPGTILFTSHDHQFTHTIATRIIEITPKGVINKLMSYDDYIDDPDIKQLRKDYYC